MNSGRSFTLCLVMIYKNLFFLVFKWKPRVNLVDRQTDSMMVILKATLFVKYTSVQHSGDLMTLKFVRKGDKYSFAGFDIIDQESTLTSH